MTKLPRRTALELLLCTLAGYFANPLGHILPSPEQPIGTYDSESVTLDVLALVDPSFEDWLGSLEHEGWYLNHISVEDHTWDLGFSFGKPMIVKMEYIVYIGNADPDRYIPAIIQHQIGKASSYFEGCEDRKCYHLTDKRSIFLS